MGGVKGPIRSHEFFIAKILSYINLYGTRYDQNLIPHMAYYSMKYYNVKSLLGRKSMTAGIVHHAALSLHETAR